MLGDHMLKGPGLISEQFSHSWNDPDKGVWDQKEERDGDGLWKEKSYT